MLYGKGYPLVMFTLICRWKRNSRGSPDKKWFVWKYKISIALALSQQKSCAGLSVWSDIMLLSATRVIDDLLEMAYWCKVSS